MQAIARVREGHLELDDLIARIRRILRAEVADAAAVTTARWCMYRALGDHCMLEDQAVFQRLLICGQARLTVLALRFREEMVPLVRRFRAGISDWPVERINRDWPGYVAVVTVLLDDLEKWIWFEDQLVLPLLQELLQQRAAA